MGAAALDLLAGRWRVNAYQSGTWSFTLAPVTVGGLSTFHLVSAASTNPTVIKAAPGQVCGWFIYNKNAAARKVAFHDTASAPTAGVAIKFSLPIPPGAGANLIVPVGIQFDNGIAITTVTELADSGNTGVAAEDLTINVWYA